MDIPKVRYSKWELEVPDTPIVSLDEIKEICYIDSDITDDDTMLLAMEKAASNLCSSFIGYPLLFSTRVIYTDIVKKPCTPITSKYTLKGVLEVMGIAVKLKDGAYNLYNDADIPDIYVVSESNTNIKELVITDPSIFTPELYPIDSFQITVRAGFGADPVSVPEELKLGIKLLIANWYEHREDQKVGQTITSSAKALWSTYKLARV